MLLRIWVTCVYCPKQGSRKVKNFDAGQAAKAPHRASSTWNVSTGQSICISSQKDYRRKGNAFVAQVVCVKFNDYLGHWADNILSPHNRLAYFACRVDLKYRPLPPAITSINIFFDRFSCCFTPWYCPNHLDTSSGTSLPRKTGTVGNTRRDYIEAWCRPRGSLSARSSSTRNRGCGLWVCNSSSRPPENSPIHAQRGRFEWQDSKRGFASLSGRGMCDNS